MEEHYKTRQQLATELGISTKTLSRKLQGEKIVLPRGLIPPKLYTELLRLLQGEANV